MPDQIFCGQCGAPNKAGARHCVNCGNALPQTTATPAPAPTEPAPSRRDPAIDRGDGSGARHPSLAALAIIVAGVVAVAAIAAGAVVLSNRNDNKHSDTTTIGSVTTDESTTSTTIPATTTTTIETTTTVSTLDRGVAEIEGLLAKSALGRTELKNAAIIPFNACSISGAQAAARMNDVVSNRQQILGSLATLGTSPDPTIDDLVRHLESAMQPSLESDFAFQRWMQAQPGSTCPRTHTLDLDQGNALSSQATAGKQQFLAIFDGAASAAGMRSNWTDSDF